MSKIWGVTLPVSATPLIFQWIWLPPLMSISEPVT